MSTHTDIPEWGGGNSASLGAGVWPAWLRAACCPGSRRSFQDRRGAQLPRPWLVALSFCVRLVGGGRGSPPLATLEGSFSLEGARPAGLPRGGWGDAADGPGGRHARQSRSWSWTGWPWQAAQWMLGGAPGAQEPGLCADGHVQACASSVAGFTGMPGDFWALPAWRAVCTTVAVPWQEGAA